MSDLGYSNMHKMLKDFLCDLQRSAANLGVPGISSGFSPLDRLTGGFENGKLYVIGGRPGIGKEEFMLSMIRYIALIDDLPTLLFSTNYQKKDYVERLVSICYGIPSSHMWMDNPLWSQIDEAIGDAPLFIHNGMDLPLDELVETARNCISEEGIKIIFIDSLQMIDLANEDGNSTERIAKVMLSLKQLARQNDVPIVVGSMLNRGVEHQDGIEGKKPQLKDLANSGYIEELSDVIMMVHRPEYYHIYENEHGQDLRGFMEIVLRKNSLKPLSSVSMNYHQETGDVTLRDCTSKTVSKPVSLKDFGTDNRAVGKLVKALDLEEEPMEKACVEKVLDHVFYFK